MGALIAIRRFFDRLPADHPFAFVFAIHIAEDWVPLVASLLAKTTPLHVQLAGLRRMLYPRDLLVVPADGIQYDERAAPGAQAHRLSIDDILTTLAERYHRNIGVIVLSGIAAEGAQGCRAVLSHGGRVWTQSFDSCQFSSLPRYIHDHCDVSYSGAPEALAVHVMETVAARPAQYAGPPWLRGQT